MDRSSSRRDVSGSYDDDMPNSESDGKRSKDGDMDSIERIFESKDVPPWQHQLTLRAFVVSFILGIMFTFIVMKLNLTTGIIPSLNVSAGLLGFFFVKTWTKFLNKSGMLKQPFTRQENTVIQTCVVATSGIAFSVGYNGSEEDQCLLKTCVRHFHLNHSYLLCTHNTMKQLAEQELKILETQHPTKFQNLKLELKAFIKHFDEEEQEESFKRKQQQQQQQQRSHMSIITQESSNRKRESLKVGKTKRRRLSVEGKSGAIEKAEACLRKIERLKSFFCPSNG